MHPSGSDPRQPSRLRRLVGASLVAAWLAAGAALPAAAHDHDPEEAGHPLRVVAYVLHPVGVALDWLIMRPAHWVGHHEPFRTLFGHEDEY
jgi:hypothetical protein